MLNVGFGEIIVIALVLLMVVGPEQLPSVIRRFGQVVGQAKSMTDGLRSEFMSGLDEIERAADVESWARDSDDVRSDDKSGGDGSHDAADGDAAKAEKADGKPSEGNSGGKSGDGGNLPKAAPIAVPAPFSSSSSADPAVRTNGSKSSDDSDDQNLDAVTGVDPADEASDADDLEDDFDDELEEDFEDEDLFENLTDEQRALLEGDDVEGINDRNGDAGDANDVDGDGRVEESA